MAVRLEVPWGIIFLTTIFAATLVECDIKLYYVGQREGSTEGGTLVTANGKEFAKDQFNNDDPTLGHKMEFYNATHVIPCPVEKYLSNPAKIVCRTRAAWPGEYTVRVYKDGTEISKLGGTYCENSWHRDHCKYRYIDRYTPKAQTVTPSSGTPGSLVEIYGQTFSSQYSAAGQESDSSRKIKRVTMSSYNCDLLNQDTQKVYGITPRSEGSSWNTVKCKPKGSFVGSQVIKFDIHNLGRSTVRDTLKISGKKKRYNYQTHAEITAISPASGSTEGGTLLTITGNYFDPRGTTDVYVGGVPCKVQSVTNTEIKCITGKEPETAPALYPGGRGAYFDKFDTYFNLGKDELKWNTTAPEYTTLVHEAASPLNLDNNFVGRLRGFFVAPWDGYFSLVVRGDDANNLMFSNDTDFTNMKEIATGIKYTGFNWFTFKEQVSEKMYLKAGEPHHFEARYREFGGADWVQAAVVFYDLPYMASQLPNTFNEKQRIQVGSDSKKERQTLTLGKDEIQQVVVKHTGCEGSINAERTAVVDCVVSGTFTLTHGGQTTGDLNIDVSAADMEAALEGLSSLNVNIIVERQTDGLITWTFTITFHESADLAQLTATVSDQANMESTVTDVQAGAAVAADHPFVLSYGDRDTVELTKASNASDVQDALLALFYTTCTAQTNGYFIDGFEAEPTGKQTGQRVTDKVPFCGRYSLKNPGVIFEADQIFDQRGQSPNKPSSIGFSYADKVCFAIVGTIHKIAQFTVQFLNAAGQSQTELLNRIIFDVSNGNDYATSSWVYHCIELRTIFADHSAVKTNKNFRISKIQLVSNQKDDYFIDNLYIDMNTKSSEYWNQMPPTKYVNTISVTKTHATFDIAMTPEFCGNSFDLLKVKNAQVSSGSADPGSDSVTYTTSANGVDVLYKVDRLSAASGPVLGDVTLTWKEKSVTVPLTATAAKVKESLETLDTGVLIVEQSADDASCHGSAWEVEWTTRGGSQELIEVDTSAVTGPDVTGNSTRLQEGFVLVGPIPGEFLRVPHKVPQVQVVVNGITSSCKNETDLKTCDYAWSEDDTPTVTAVSNSGKSGDSITITVTGFSTTNADNTVTIGGVPCVVTGSTATSISCTVGEGLADTHKIMVKSLGGFAAHPSSGDVEFTYEAAITSVAPAAGSTAGGTEVTITGYGFPSNKAGVNVTVDGNLCVVKSSSYTQVVFVISLITSSGSGRKKRSSSGITINTGGTAVNSPSGFTFDPSLTPAITSLTPGSSSVTGGGNLVIAGTGFAASGNTVTIGGTACVITAESETEITCTLSGHNPGSYPVTIEVPVKGFADVGSNGQFTYDLKITGLSPSTGSILGGTMTTISGSGFGTDSAQVSVAFGDWPCAIQTIENTKIVCETSPAGKTHHITNQGVHEKYGVGFRFKPRELEVSVGDIVQWAWTTPDQVTGIAYTVMQTASADAVAYDGTGFHAGQATSTGTYAFRFTSPGEYYFSSGPTGIEGVTMKGVLTVKDTSVAKQLSVTLGSYEAEHDNSQSVTVTSSGCTREESLLSGCSLTAPAVPDAKYFAFKFFKCSTPVIESVTKEAISTTQITITGRGFGTEVCQNEVKINQHVCTPATVSDTSITCDIVTAGTLIVGIPQFIFVKVNNRGNAMNEGVNIADQAFTFIAQITSLSKSEGPIAGGTSLTITGDGFDSSGSVVTIGGAPCVIESVTYTAITCITSSKAAGTDPVSLFVNNKAAQCPNGCDFKYNEAITPTVTAVNPTSVSGAATEITITGTLFSTEAADMTVTIGGVPCVVSSATLTSIVCSVGYVRVGTAELIVSIANVGLAHFTDASHKNIQSSAVLDTVDPKLSSRRGGLVITITGNGFHVDSTTVMIGDKECTINSITISEIKCTTQGKSSGDYPLKVTSGTAAYPEQTITYHNDVTPAVSSITPTAGKSGDEITISGHRFSETPENNVVSVGEVGCTVTSATANSIVCNVEAHSAGAFGVMVNVVGKGLSNNNVQFTYSLSVTSTSPDTSGFGGGRTLTVGGIGFGSKDTTTVTVCGNKCPILTITATTVECDVPGNSGTDATLACDVVVTVEGFDPVTKAGAWTYDRSKTATITSVSPKRGGTGGGTTLTIVGTGFVASGNVVTIDGTACVVQSESTTQITCRTGQRSTTIKTKVRVDLGGDKGIATQDKAEFYYVDLWSSTFTWGGKDPPVQGDFVVIKKGQTVMLDVDTPVLKMVLLQGGGLIFDDEKDSITLNAEHILIVEQGFLEIGTEEEPYQHKATIVMHGHVLSKELPLYGAKTLAVRSGRLDLHGKHVQYTWTHLAATINPGDNTMTLMKKVDWQVGDRIVVASTGTRHAQRENEEFTITAVSDDGLTLTFEPAVKYEHISLLQTIDGVTLETRAEVGLLTRNIVVRGSFQDEWNEVIPACPEEFDTNQFAAQKCFQGKFGEEPGSDEFGSQIMLFASEPDKHLVIGRIEYVEVTHAGQAFHLGRYPIHFHLNGDVTGNYVRGCAIHHTFNRAVTIHAVHNLLVEHNVAYNVMGHAYFLEDGIETKNIIQFNLAVFVRSSNSLLNVDVTPAAFWVTNPDNIVRHNAAAGGSHFGYWYNAPAHPGGPSFTNQVCPRNVPLLEFRNNTAHTMGWYGIWIFPIYYPMELVNGKSCSNDPRASVPATFDGLKVWRTERGAEAVEVGNVRFENFLMLDNVEAGIEFQTTKDGWGGPWVKNSNIFSYSALTPDTDACTKDGIKLPKSDYLTVDGVKFINFDRGDCAAVRACSHCKIHQGGFSTEFKNIRFVNSPNKTSWQWEHEAWIEDLDGTFTGKGSPGYKVLPKNALLPSDHCEFDVADFEIGSIKGAICDSTVDFHRMAFNNPKPSSLAYKDVLFTNSHGTTHIPYHKKRITHPKGWMLTLIDGMSYNMFFWDADHITNISYSATFYNFKNSDFVTMKHNLTQEPDKFAINGTIADPVSAVPTYTANVHGDYFFDTAGNELTYIVSGKGDTELTNKNVQLNVYQCHFQDCIPPPPEVVDPPADSRPNDFLTWSNVESWRNQPDGYGSGDGVLPIVNADVMIMPGVWMVADVDTLPKMKKLVIYGVLELDPTKDFKLEATYILIQGGRLIAGFPNTPYTRSGQIILHGQHSTEEMILPSGPVLGSKALGAFGGLDLHGVVHNVYWTHLKDTVAPGDNTLTVTEDTDWKVNDDIMVTTTDYDAWHTETFKITAVNGRTFTLDSTFKYKHVASTQTRGGQSYDMRAEVGLLTRNIKIEGNNYNNLISESFGARVLVGTFTQDGKLYKGYARISNVEFYHSGQEGHRELYDPRFSLAYLNTGDVTNVYPSFVTGCSFHHGFSPSIGIVGANSLQIKDNVIHHVVGPGIVDSSNGNTWDHNLIALVIFPGTYLDRSESENLLWEGGFEVQKAQNPVLTNNAVAGSERVGFKIKGELCDSASTWSGNVVHGALHGIQIFNANQKDCSKINGFVAYRNFDFGIYIQGSSGVVISNAVLADNHVGILAMIVGPASLKHQTSNKKVEVTDSLIVGMSPVFECGVDDSIEPAVAGHARSHSKQLKAPDGGFVGIAFSTFMSGPNGAPFKAFIGLKNYPALSGVTDLKNVKFGDFQKDKCGKHSYMIMTNKKNGDFQHPVQAQGITKENVDVESIVFIHRSDIGLVNPADCVDMDCDAQKKALVRDLDGSLKGDGKIGTIVPQSEWQWDGDDKRRGLGDYRIPRTLLTNPSTGARINAADKVPNKGIYGVHSDKCTWKPDWQAYDCDEIDHMILIFESMDADTEVRRLSPQALYTADAAGGYIDLVNGPQDHGWCHGYTCQERISTFYTMVATGRLYEVHFTSTNPQHMRVHLLNAVASQKVVVGIYYSNPQRLDVYYNKEYVLPTNGERDANGELVWQNQPGQNYLPTVSSTTPGANYFKRDTSTLYILVSGSTPVDIHTTPVIMVSFGVPAQTVDEFFGPKIVENLAAFLGIDKSKIRIVDIIAEDSVRRRRSAHIIDYERRRNRRATGGIAELVLEIGDNPEASAQEADSGGNDNPSPDNPVETPPSAEKLEFNKLAELTEKIVNDQQTGQLAGALKVEVATLAVTEPEAPPTDPTGGVRATEESGGPTTGEKTFAEVQAEQEEARLAETASVVLLTPSQLTIVTEASGASENQPFTTQPKIEVKDANGARVNQLGASSNPWRLRATLRANTGTAGATLAGTVEAPFENGFATFTDLAISKEGSGYLLDFNIVYPDTSTLAVMSSSAIAITPRIYKGQVLTVPSNAYVDEAFAITVAIKDDLTSLLPQGIADKGLTWKATASILNPDNYKGALSGTLEATFDLTNAQAEFNNLIINAKGYRYIIQFKITTEPSSSYDFTVDSSQFDVKVKGQADPTGSTKKFTFRFGADYDSIIPNNEVAFEINFVNTISDKFGILMSNVAITKGSILAAFDAQGADLAATQTQMLDDLSKGEVELDFKGQKLTADNYLMVDGQAVETQEQTGSGGIPNENEPTFPGWAIALIVLFAIVMLVVVIVVVYFIFCRKKKENKVAQAETFAMESEKAHLTAPVAAISANSSLASIRKGTDSPMMSAITEDEALSFTKKTQDVDDLRISTPLGTPASMRRSNTPRRTPEIAVTSLPPGFTEGQHEKEIEDRTKMNLMARNEADGTFTKLGVLNVNLVGSISELRVDINTALLGTEWKDKYILMKETLKDILEADEDKVVVSEVYTSDCVLIRWDSQVKQDDGVGNGPPAELSPRDLEAGHHKKDKPRWKPTF